MKVHDSSGRLKIIRTEASASRVVTVKPTDEAITSDSTYSDDDTLVVTIPAGETWVVSWYLFWNSPSTPDIKFRVNTTGSAETPTSFRWAILDDRLNYSSDDGSNSEGGQSYSSAGADDTTRLYAAIQASSLGSATVALQWAQNTSNGSATTMYAMSYLVAEKAG